MRFRILVYAIIMSGGDLRTSSKTKTKKSPLLLFKLENSSAEWSASGRPVRAWGFRRVLLQ